MGDIADNLTEDEELTWFDHLAGHPNFPSDYCQYCEYADEQEAHEEEDY